MQRSFIPFLALKHIRRRSLQSALTVLGVAVGVMVLIVALSLTNGFINELIGSTLRATPHITLSAIEGGIAESDETLELIQDHPDVVAVAPYIETQALIVRPANSTLGITATKGFTNIIGIDPELESKVLDLSALTDVKEELERGDGIVLGASLARTISSYQGEMVRIMNIDFRREELTVAATFNVGNEIIDNLVSFTSIPVMQSYLEAEGQLTGYHVRVRDPDIARRVGRELGQDLGLIPYSWDSIFKTLIDQLELQKALISMVVFLIVLVAAMGIANILILTVAEKTDEIAILRALGASQRQVVMVFTLEGFILGGAGTILGAILGVVVSLFFILKPYSLPGDLYFITQLPAQLKLADFLWVCSMSLITSVLAGIFPARRASRLNPVEILR